MNEYEGQGIDAAEQYFTCQCSPPFETVREPGSLYAHRIPIDCMTAEDWQRVARAKQWRAATVYVVSVEGDQDCGYENEGAIAVYANAPGAWKAANLAAEAFLEERADWDKDPTYDVDDEGIHLEKGSYYVKKMTVE